MPPLIWTSLGYPTFGMVMPGHWFSSSNYRYGYNGKERTDEISPDGSGNDYDFGARIYDDRIGKFLSIDAHYNKYPDKSPFVSFSNNPIIYVDPSGLDDYYTVMNGKVTFMGSDGKTTTDQRLIKTDDYYKFGAAPDKKITEEQVKGLQSNSVVIGMSLPENKSEGDFFKAMYDKGKGDKIENTKEESAEILLTFSTDDKGNYTKATLGVHMDDDKYNAAFICIADDDSKVVAGYGKNVAVIAGVHTHQVADLLGDDTQKTSNHQTGDENKTRVTGRPEFSYDSKNIQSHTVKNGVMTPTYVENADYPGKTSELYKNNFSILRTALELAGKTPYVKPKK